MTEHFWCLVALGLPDRITVSLLLVPTARCPTLSAKTKACQWGRGQCRLATGIKWAPEALWPQYGQWADWGRLHNMGGGRFHLDTPSNEKPFPRGSTSCPGFSCLGNVGHKKNRECSMQHIFNLGTWEHEKDWAHRRPLLVHQKGFVQQNLVFQLLPQDNVPEAAWW